MSSLLVFSRFIDLIVIIIELKKIYRLEIQSVMLVFSTPLVNYRPSNHLNGSPPPS
jgi:hypothetical protein